jgi:predicted nucleic acid-binding protein
METFLLETSAFSELMRGQPKLVARLASETGTSEVIICSIVRGEIRFGIERLAKGRRRQELETKSAAFFGIIPCKPVPAEAGDHYATLKLARRAKGLTLDDNDLWIAATPLALGAVLVTRDSDFQKIDGLPVEDWTV